MFDTMQKKINSLHSKLKTAFQHFLETERVIQISL